MLFVGGRASGKTTKAIHWLDEQGGGWLITRHAGEVKRLIQNMNPALKNPEKIYVLEVGMRSMVVDDIDHGDTYATYTDPTQVYPTRDRYEVDWSNINDSYFITDRWDPENSTQMGKDELLTFLYNKVMGAN